MELLTSLTASRGSSFATSFASSFTRRTGALLGACSLAASALVAMPAAAPTVADAYDVECDGKWHFDPVGDPVFDRVVADSFTFDNRQGNEPLERTERVKETLTRSFSHSAEIGISVEAGFDIFAASMKTTLSASYKFSFTETNSIEKETEVRHTVGPRKGYTYNVGIQTVAQSGYYERILDCDRPSQRYQRVGPLTVEVPGVGKAVWTEALPAPAANRNVTKEPR